jgi:hypothetical protein
MLNPFIHELMESNPQKMIELYCFDCKGGLIRYVYVYEYEFKSNTSPSVDFLGLFFPVNLNPNNFVLDFNQYKGLSINQVDKNYLEFLLIQNSSSKFRTYEVGLTLSYINAIEHYLGKWFNPNESKWIEL